MSGRTLDEFVGPDREPRIDHRHLRALRQAAVAAESLTGDESWDIFLSYLQSAVNETGKQLATLQNRLMAPTTVNHEEILTLKIGIAECQARISAWSAAIKLPNDIKEKGRNAKALMEGS